MDFGNDALMWILAVALFVSLALSTATVIVLIRRSRSIPKAASPDCVYVSNLSNSNVTQLNDVKLVETRPIKPDDALMLANVKLSLKSIQKCASC